MSIQERANQMIGSENFIMWAAGLALAALWWVVRTVLTNKHRVDAIEKKTDEIHKDVREIRGAIMSMKGQGE